MAGWIGVDLDCTLAHLWSADKIGPPIEKMLARVKRHLAEGRDVRIFTARANIAGQTPEGLAFNLKIIREWCVEHLGRELPITCAKDFAMDFAYDDKMVQVIPETGERVDGAD